MQTQFNLFFKKFKFQKKLFVRVVAPKTISHFGEILRPIFLIFKNHFLSANWHRQSSEPNVQRYHDLQINFWSF
jgi:hypothetical protein